MNGKDGTPATANFLSGMMKSIPPMNEMFDMAGMELPAFLGKKKEEGEKASVMEEVDKSIAASTAGKA